MICVDNVGGERWTQEAKLYQTDSILQQLVSACSLANVIQQLPCAHRAISVLLAAILNCFNW